MNARQKELHAELLEFTAGCRPDMHEPEEQELKARVVGDHLDNACGSHIGEKQIIEGYQEYVVCLNRFDDTKPVGHKFMKMQINLADLIALARMAG